MRQMLSIGLVCSAVVGGVVLWTADAGAKDVQVCVDVVIKIHEEPADKTTSAEEPPEPPAPPPIETKEKLHKTEKPPRRIEARRPQYAFPPRVYLKRLLQHFVTHERGFVAVSEGCQQRLTVELYPLNRGWTVFARYTGFQQEEKVDRVTFPELPKLAERVVLALLHNRRIEETIHRLNVLEADSLQAIETIKGTNHFVASVGTSIKVPVPGIATARNADGSTEQTVRLLSAVTVQLGYRGSFRSWGIDAFGRVGFGVNSRKAQRNNLLGGHVDHDVDIGLGMTFHWYLNPRGVNSFYAGTGALLDISVFDVVEPEEWPHGASDNDKLVGAGLSVLGVVGYEFLRTSRVRPYLQAELSLPLYVYDIENDFGGINAWTPGASLQLGVMF